MTACSFDPTSLLARSGGLQDFRSGLTCSCWSCRRS